MKKNLETLMLIAATLLNQFSSAQNLVPNPSFEDTVACPYYGGDIDKAAGWSSYGNTPDYFNVCSNSTGAPIGGVPQNIWGYQSAFNGNGYAGLATTDGGFPFREFIGIQLIQPLMVGNKYFASAYISRADSFPCLCSSNNFSFRFSNFVYASFNSAPVDNFSHIHSDSIITNSIGWTRIAGSFIADSAYQYLILGNFYDDTHTDTLNCPNGNVSYYYVDAICVSADSTYCLSWNGIENISNEEQIYIFPNPVNNLLFIKNVLGKEFSYKLVNVMGQIVKKGTIYCQLNTIDVSSLSNGIYFLEINENNLRKIVISH